jgi:hypothetical protein
MTSNVLQMNPTASVLLYKGLYTALLAWNKEKNEAHTRVTSVNHVII